MKKIDNFLKELEQLSRKHKMFLRSCGYSECLRLDDMNDSENDKKYSYKYEINEAYPEDNCYDIVSYIKWE